MNLKFAVIKSLCLIVLAGCGGPSPEPPADPEPVEVISHENVMIDLWEQDAIAFGVYVPNEAPPPPDGARRGRGQRPPAVYTVEGGETLAQNPLYDFVFLNLEGRYNADAIRAIGEGLRSAGAVSRKTLLVRIPPISNEDAGADVTRARVAEALDLGADGIVIPHVRSTEEAQLASSFFADAGADVWSPSNPEGEILAMLMLEDPAAVAAAAEIADLGGYSALSCGCGSLSGAIARERRGDVDPADLSDEERSAERAAAGVEAEVGNQKVLAEAKRVGIANMTVASADDVEQRVGEGFSALLMSGDQADSTIDVGRAAAGRQ